MVPTLSRIYLEKIKEAAFFNVWISFSQKIWIKGVQEKETNQIKKFGRSYI